MTTRSIDRLKRFIGRDPQGVPRVTASHPNIDVAETWCASEILYYAQSRPELWPIEAWTIERVTK